MRLFLAPVTFALALVLPQEPKQPGDQDPPARPGGRFETEAERSVRAREGILGAWQLSRGEIPSLGVSAGGVAGYALFMDGYMSLEFHVLGNTSPDSSNTFFQTGTHRWKLEDNGLLQTYSLIGTHNVTDDEEYDFEVPGQRREYRVRLDGEQLVLEKNDRTARFTFTRLGKLRFPDAKDGATDFYGRPIKQEAGKPEEGKPRKPAQDSPGDRDR